MDALLHVQVRRRLVEQVNVGIGNACQRAGEALQLAAGQILAACQFGRSSGFHGRTSALRCRTGPSSNSAMYLAAMPFLSCLAIISPTTPLNFLGISSTYCKTLQPNHQNWGTDLQLVDRLEMVLQLVAEVRLQLGTAEVLSCGQRHLARKMQTTRISSQLGGSLKRPRFGFMLPDRILSAVDLPAARDSAHQCDAAHRCRWCRPDPAPDQGAERAGGAA